MKEGECLTDMPAEQQLRCRMINAIMVLRTVVEVAIQLLLCVAAVCYASNGPWTHFVTCLPGNKS